MATMDDTVDLTKSSDDERGQRGEEVPFDSRGDGRASIKAASYPAKRPKLVELDRNVLMSSAAPRAPMPVDSASSGSDSDSAGPSCREKGSTSKQQRTLFLASIGNLSDRTLQQMLFNRRFFFRLKPHQFAAVRFVAGVPSDYPTITDKANGALKVMNFPAPQTHGAILADQMGLGKTVECLGGCVLRLAASRPGEVRQKTLIVTPNGNVSEQWREHLHMGGVEDSDVLVAGDGELFLKTRSWIVMTRYQVLSSVKKSLVSAKEGRFKVSFLWPNLTAQTAQSLAMMRDASNGKAKNTFRKSGESEADAMTRFFKEKFFGASSSSSTRRQASWCTVIVDEAHFLKNPLTYWGIGTALLGCHAQRIICATGTPFNNGPQDMAALMSYIDPRVKEAKKKFWEDATAHEAAPDSILEALKSWRGPDHDPRYILRRDKSLVADLPSKTQSTTPIALNMMDYNASGYADYESRCIKQMEVLAKLVDDTNPKAVLEKMRLSICILSTMACMRMSLIDAVLPQRGREVTAHFSPSRRGPVLQQLASTSRSQGLCVGCQANSKEQNEPECKQEDEQGSQADDDEEDEEERSHAGKGAAGGKRGGGGRNSQRVSKSRHARADRYLDNESTDEEEADGYFDGAANKPKKGTIKLGANLCASAETCPHYVCVECEAAIRAAFRASGLVTCPRCCELQRRMENSFHQRTPGQRVCCQNIYPWGKETKMASGRAALGGFVCSAKIQQALDWVNKLPAGEKGIIFSFFKGGFDLIEGALEDQDDPISCARFDGDVPSEARQQELVRFKTDPGCRVMLMSVGTGGTGLNITEANHVLFLDRWFNPCVHEQAMDRAHRIGQTRAVDVSFVDVNMSIDQVMAQMNNAKAGNASIILADGSRIEGAGGSSTPSFRDLSGFLLSAMKSIRAQRVAHLAASGPSALSPPATLDAGGGGSKDEGSGGKGKDASESRSPVGAQGTRAGEGASNAIRLKSEGKGVSDGGLRRKEKERMTQVQGAAPLNLAACNGPIKVDTVDDGGDAGKAAARLLKQQEKEDLRKALAESRSPQPQQSQTALKVGSARAGETGRGPFWVQDEDEDLLRVDLDPAAAAADRPDVFDMTVD